MKPWSLLCCGLLAAGVLLGLCMAPAGAMAPFRKEFVAKYVKPQSADPKDKAFAAAVETAKCNVCHVGKDKKVRNAYGKALAQYLTEDDAENTAKIRDALEKVAKMKANAADASSPTFGEVIQAGKLPAGDTKETPKAEAK
jgi:hypothetical protein